MNKFNLYFLKNLFNVSGALSIGQEILRYSFIILTDIILVQLEFIDTIIHIWSDYLKI